MNKLKKFIFTLVSSVLFLGVNGSIFAYSGGILNGIPLNVGTSISESLGTASGMTDNNENTFTTMQASTTTAGYVDTAWHQFSSPKTITDYQIKAPLSANLSIQFYDSNKNVIGTISPTPDGVQRSITPVNNVSYVALLNNATTPVNISEFDVFENVDTTPPGEINGLLTSSTVDSVSLQWNNPGDPDLKSIKIYRSGSLITTINAPGNSYTDTNLSSNTQYDYKISTVDTIGNESTGKNISVWTQAPDTTPPADVSNVQTTIYDDRIKMTWVNPPDNDFIEVRIFKNGVLTTVVTTPATQYIDMDLSMNTTYTYLLRSRDTSGNMSAGVTATATTSGVPGTPTGINGMVGDSKVDLHWDDMTHTDTNLDGYNIYQDGVLINSTPIHALTYQVTGLTNGQQYSFQVSSVDTLGHESPLSGSYLVIPVIRTVPFQPNVKYTASRNSVTLQWEPVQFADHYEIYQETSSGTALLNSFITDTSYTISNLDSGTSYTYSVVAVNDLGSSDPGTVIAKTTTDINLSVPNNISAADAFQSGVSLASNFWPFLLLGLSFVLVPWIYMTIRKSATQGKQPDTKQVSRGEEKRTNNRKIRHSLRGE